MEEGCVFWHSYFMLDNFGGGWEEGLFAFQNKGILGSFSYPNYLGFVLGKFKYIVINFDI